MNVVELKKEIQGSILDIGGGGEGVIGRVYTNQVTAIDRLQQELDEAPDCCRKLVMDAQNLRFENESFDAVTMFYTLLYMNRNEQQTALQQACRVLKQGGKLYLWDTEITDLSQSPVLVQVAVNTEEFSLKTTYGVKTKQTAQTAAEFEKMLFGLRMDLVQKQCSENGFYLVFQKPIKRISLVIDGRKFCDTEGFFAEMDNLLTKDLTWKTGHNFDAFHDILRGGFGVEFEEGIDFQWIYAEKSKQDFGYEATVRCWQEILENCHPANRNSVKQKIKQAQRQMGKTVFDMIVEEILDKTDCYCHTLCLYAQEKDT